MADLNSGPIRKPDDLTPAQFGVLLFVLDFRRSHGRSPTGSELARHFGWASTTSAYNHVKTLIERGYLTSSPFGQSRLNAWKPTPKARRFDPDALPLLGYIPAGPLSDAMESDAASLYYLQDLVPGLRPDDLFYHVATDALIGKGIVRGSLAIARPGNNWTDGTLVVLQYGSRLLLRFLYRTTLGLRLSAANPHIPDMEIASDAASIIGPVIATVQTKSFLH